MTVCMCVHHHNYKLHSCDVDPVFQVLLATFRNVTINRNGLSNNVMTEMLTAVLDMWGLKQSDDKCLRALHNIYIRHVNSWLTILKIMVAHPEALPNSTSSCHRQIHSWTASDSAVYLAMDTYALCYSKKYIAPPLSINTLTFYLRNLWPSVHHCNQYTCLTCLVFKAFHGQFCFTIATYIHTLKLVSMLSNHCSNDYFVGMSWPLLDCLLHLLYLVLCS